MKKLTIEQIKQLYDSVHGDGAAAAANVNWAQIIQILTAVLITFGPLVAGTPK